MATTKIRGITIQLGGDTAGLSKALKDVNGDIRSTEKQLKDVNRLLKLDPKNTELLAQKQRYLGQEIEQTKSKLKSLKNAEVELNKEFKEGKIPRETMDALKREIIATESALKSLVAASDTGLQDLGEGFKKAGDKIAGAGKALLPATGAVVGLGVAAFKTASDTAESMNKVDVAFKGSAAQVKAFADTALESYGIAEGTALDMAALYGDMATGMGISERKAADMATSLTGLAGDLASFKNIGVEQAMTALNGVFTGETESLKTLGVVMTEANLKAYALSHGIKKEYKELSQAEKVQLRYKYVLNATKNAQGDFARTSGGAANSTRILSESTKELASEFGEVLLPIITPIIQKLTKAVQWIGGLDEKTKKVIVAVAGIIALGGPLLIFLGKTATSIGTIIGLLSKMHTGLGALHGFSLPKVTQGFSVLSAAIKTKVTAAFTVLTQTVLPALGRAFSSVASFIVANPIVLIIAAVVGLVAVIAANGEKIKEVLSKLDDWLQRIFATDWTKIFGPVLGGALNDFAALVKAVWDGIKGTFEGIIDFIQGAFTGNWKQAWQGVVKIFKSVFGMIWDVAKMPLNGVLRLVNGVISGINFMISGLNRLKIKIPKWVPGIGGSTLGFNISKIPSVPYLAKGGILTKGSAVVGEAGPELLTMQGGRAIVQPLTGSGARPTITQNNIFNNYQPRDGAAAVRDLNRQLGWEY